jgi:hypothetical protein
MSAVVSSTTTVLGGLSFALGKLTGMFVQSFNVYDNLVKTGMMSADASRGLTGGLSDLGTLMMESKVNLGTLNKVYTENSRAIKQYGSGAFVNSINDMRESMYQFGMNSNQFAEYFAGNLEEQRKLGFASRLTQAQQQSYLTKSTSNLFAFSKALGASYEELQRQAREATAGQDFEMFIRTMGDAGTKIKQSADMVSMGLGSDTGKLVAEFATLTEGMQGASPMFQQLYSNGLGPLADELWKLSRQVRSGTITQDNYQDAIKRATDVAKSYNTEENFQLLTNIKHTLGKGNEEMFNTILSFIQTSETLDKQRLSEIAAGNEQVESVKRVQDRWNHMFVSLQASIIKNFDELFTPGNTTLDRIGEFLRKVVDVISSDRFQESIEYLMNSIINLADSIANFRWQDVLTSPVTLAIAGIVAALVTFKSAIAAITTDIFSRSGSNNKTDKSGKNKSGPGGKLLKGAGLIGLGAAMPSSIGNIMDFGKAVYDLEKTHWSLNKSKESAAETDAELKKMWEDLSKRTGLTITSRSDFMSAEEKGLIKFNEGTGSYERTNSPNVNPLTYVPTNDDIGKWSSDGGFVPYSDRDIADREAKLQKEKEKLAKEAAAFVKNPATENIPLLNTSIQELVMITKESLALQKAQLEEQQRNTKVVARKNDPLIIS